MKTNTLTTVFGSAAIALALFASPIAASAADVKATSTASVRINQDGIVRVIGAEVTSISGNIVNAVTRFKNNVVNWTFTTNASTTVVTSKDTSATTTAGLRVGDLLTVTGALTSLNGTMGVQAAKILDTTLLASWRVKTGTVQSVNLANGTFVIKSDDKLVTVQTNASTTFMLGNGTSTNTLANVAVGSKVAVYGQISSSGTLLTATKVVAKLDGKQLKKEMKDILKKDKKDPHSNGKGRDDEIHSLKTNLGLQIGLGNR